MRLDQTDNSRDALQLGLTRADSTRTGYDQVHALDGETVAGGQMGSDLVDEGALVMIDLPAGPAYEMELLVGVGHLPTGRTLARQLRLTHHVEVGKQRQRAIYRGQIYRRIPGVDTSCYLVCSEMGVGLAEYLPYQQTRPGDAVAPTAQDGAELGLDVHGMMLTRLAANHSQLRYDGDQEDITTVHAPDGFLNAGTAVATGALSAGAIGVSLRQTRTKLADKHIPLAGIAAAFVFAAQMFNFPVAAGTTGHLLGGALVAILLGPAIGAVVVAIVVVVQALAFVDGGLTALGYNILNMAVITAFGGWALFALLRRVMPRSASGLAAAAGIAAAGSVVLSSMAFSLEWLFGATAPVAFDTVFGAMVGVHLVIGVGEGVITALAVAAVLAARPDLVYGARHLSADQLADHRSVGTRTFAIAAVLVALVFAAVVSQFASGDPDGLQRVAADIGIGQSAEDSPLGGFLFANYATSGVANEAVSLAVAGVSGVIITLLVGFGVFSAVGGRRDRRRTEV